MCHLHKYFAKCISLKLSLVGLNFVGLLSYSWDAFALPQGHAFGSPGAEFRWASAAKEVVGTAYEAYKPSSSGVKKPATGSLSTVWYTGTQGILTETYYPSVDTAQTKDTQLLITDATGRFEEERALGTAVVTASADSPLYTVETTSSKERYVIKKKIFADPDRNAVVTEYEIVSKVPGLKFFLLHKPAAANTGGNDYAQIGSDATGHFMHAWEGDAHQTVVSSVGFKALSAGYSGKSDGWHDLNENGQMNWEFAHAGPGNIALTGQLNLPESPGTYRFTVAVGFGRTQAEAHKVSADAVKEPAQQKETFTQQWKTYLDHLKALKNPQSNNSVLQYRVSLWTAKSHEDKTYPGAVIASLTIPWGEHEIEPALAPPTRGKTGYHAVWPRDLSQTALALLHAGDTETSVAIAKNLQRVQFGADAGAFEFGWRRWPKMGSWTQNMWVDGTPHWTGLQIDQVAFPVLLVYQLWDLAKIDPLQFRNMVISATDFLAEHGAESPMERWEEIHGYSPSNIASVAAALVAGAELRALWGDEAGAKKLRNVSDQLMGPEGIDKWLYTTTGVHGNGEYYVRIEGASDTKQNHLIVDPNDNARIWIANGSGQRFEKEMVDAGFLELVRYGLRARNSEVIQNSLNVVDSVIRVDIPGKGPGFFRYNYDGYGNDTFPTQGQLWPIFTGERAISDMTGMLEHNQGRALDHSQLSTLYGMQRTMELFSNQGKMIPEQVWSSGKQIGRGTGSATPLVWSHAEYITLALSIEAGRPLTWIRAARERYLSK
jgi:glucoamylase